MVLQKRLDYGFNGYQVPTVPRAARSARRRVEVRKKAEDNHMLAFDLLATVADKLLIEEGSPGVSCGTSSGADQFVIGTKELQDKDKTVKDDCSDHDSQEQSFHRSEVVSQDLDTKEFQKDGHSVGLSSVVMTPTSSKELVNENCENEMGSSAGKIGNGSSSFGESRDYNLDGDDKLDDDDKVVVDYNMQNKTGEVSGLNRCNFRKLLDQDPDAHSPLSSNSSGKVTTCSMDHITQCCFPTSGDDGKLVDRDDDEKSSGCTHPTTPMNSFRRAPHIGDRRIRKVLASKDWKGASKYRSQRLSNTGGDLKPFYSNSSCKRQRSQMNIPFKKRKMFYCNAASNPDGVDVEGNSDSLEKGGKADASAIGTASSISRYQTSFQSRDSHVKLRIKSFRVPELFIEIPETATIGSLKRTVKDAVTAILGGGLRIGVLLEGKKVRDDDKTLFQSGISDDSQLDTLGFILEPKPSKTPPLSEEESQFPCPFDAPEPVSSYPPSSIVDHQRGCGIILDPHLSNVGSFVESDHDSAPSPTNVSADKSTTESKAVVAEPAMAVEALAVVPFHRKSKQSEVVQRRIRRPFSVAEVEALVQAVEKLGTGRWRDVKLCAFDNAKHRTYVDLKDKWKTLVHTARISPQQRRGEPVPQELLDRVLAAHAYWSQQHLKPHHIKRHPDHCLLL